VTIAPAPARGLVGVAASTDHKRIARLVAVTAFAFFLAGGVMALLVRIELFSPGIQVIGEGTYNQVFTMHGSTMIYLFVTPIALTFGLYLVPLQVGAAEIAAPRLALLGWWLFACGGLIMYFGFFTDGGAGSSGWTAFEPLSDSPHTPSVGMDFWIIGVTLAVAGQILWGWCILDTVLRRRAPGMTMLRLPPMTWAMVATVLMVLAAFPALILAMALLYADRHLGGVFNGLKGAIAYQHLFWFYGHPVVYVMFFPFVGAALEAAATFARRRLFGYKGVILSLLLFSALSMSVWAHHMFTTGQVRNEYFALTSTALVIPAGLEYFAFIGTLVGGVISFRVPMLFAIGFFVQFLVGGLSGIFVGSPPLDYHVHDTYVVVAHFHYTLFAGSVFGLFAGVYLWWPKVTGVMLSERLGKLHFWLLVVGTNLTFFPMFVVGHMGMVRRVADYPADKGWQIYNRLETVGAFVIALGILVFAFNAVRSLRRRIPAGDDPWGGQTLEWATTSPPPRHNFEGALPPVRSYAPLLDLRESEAGR
jgi:cytochrome c oxidase subunit I